MILSPLHPVLNCKPKQRQDWGNLYGSSIGLVISQVAQQAPLIVITPDSLTAQRLVEDIQFYAPTLSLLNFPDWETLPYDLFSPHQDIISDRLTTLYHLSEMDSQKVLVLPISTLMYRLAPSDYVKGNSLLLTKGQQFHVEQFRQILERNGYRSVSQVMEHGEFAVRGSLFDLFPMGSNVPYRIDLFDDEVDSIRRFDPETQRSQTTLDEIRLLPAREFPLNEKSIERFSHQWRATFGGNPLDCPVYQDVINELASAGIEYYLPLFFEQTQTLFDYLPHQTVIMTLEGVLETAEQFWQQVNERYEQLRHDIQRPILPPKQLFIEVNQIFAEFKTYRHIHINQTKTDKTTGINFTTQPPPQLPINAKASQPLAALHNFLAEFPGRVLIAAETTGRRESLLELLGKYQIKPKIVDNWQSFLQNDKPLCLTIAPLEQGLVLTPPNPPLARGGTDPTPPTLARVGISDAIPPLTKGGLGGVIALISETQLFGERVAQRRLRKKVVQRDTDAIVRDLTELTVGAPVVHEEHGVGRYQGLMTLTVGGFEAEFLELEYANGDKLYVPITSLHLISRFTGMDPEHAPLHRLGSAQWEKAKRKAAQKATDVAAELLDIYAQRAARQGHQFQLDQLEYQTFAQGFPFEETPDQQEAIQAVINDMLSTQPMDRLVCGDVGFGKTEVAMRACYIAIMDGQQTAVLVPTTLLAQQHYQTFKDRFADLPVRVEQLSRFRSKKQQTDTLKAVAEGQVDIVIGTHKLIQNNVQFKKLGLVIIDEEHRFGVKQKEKFKALRSEVDILTLTATPIPRSLNMALSHLRDLSIITTPPPGRLAIKTFIREWQGPLIVEAILRELKRGGQVYFLHNQIETIGKIADEVQQLVPEARVRMAHGKMRERELERVMQDFYHRRFNVLVCTTIIETGIDVPSANTIIINRADKLGLAQLYQLRGRVGRSHHRAYAYLLIPDRKAMTKDAQKRIDAIGALEELGMGFMLATHDLEIRGAGELLGSEQSGHIQEIGYGLYTELLERAVNSLKAGEQIELNQPLKNSTEVNLHSAALLPSDYIDDVHTRLIFYKRIANAPALQEKSHPAHQSGKSASMIPEKSPPAPLYQSGESPPLKKGGRGDLSFPTPLEEIEMELIDRFGLLPEPAKALMKTTEIKLTAMPLGIRKIDFGPKGGYLLFNEQPNIRAEQLVALIQEQPTDYRLEGQEKLHLLMEIAEFSERCNILENLLARLSP